MTEKRNYLKKGEAETPQNVFSDRHTHGTHVGMHANLLYALILSI